MTTPYTRDDAVINSPCLLKIKFKQEDLLYNPYQVRIVNIYSADPTQGNPPVIASYTPTQESDGVFSITVPANILLFGGGWYDKWFFTWNSGETETSVVQNFFVSNQVSLDLINKLRTLLKDQHPDFTKRRYNDTELGLYLEEALWDINSCPPGFSYFDLTTWQNYVPGWESLLLQGGMIFALISEGVFQIGIEFNYNDNGLSFETSKSQKYNSMSQMLMQNYQSKKEALKKQWWFSESGMASPHASISPDFTLKLRILSPRMLKVR